VTFATFDPGACADEADRLSALIFMLGCLCMQSADVANFCGSQKFRRLVGLANHGSNASQ
jgi:hypothetical protein